MRSAPIRSRYSLSAPTATSASPLDERIASGDSLPPSAVDVPFNSPPPYAADLPIYSTALEGLAKPKPLRKCQAWCQSARTTRVSADRVATGLVVMGLH